MLDILQTFFTTFLDIILHLDIHLQWIIETYDIWTYAILFLVIFCETGLIITPFLPGDSLLFAAGAFAALGSLNLWAVFWSVHGIGHRAQRVMPSSSKLSILTDFQ